MPKRNAPPADLVQLISETATSILASSDHNMVDEFVDELHTGFTQSHHRRHIAVKAFGSVAAIVGGLRPTTLRPIVNLAAYGQGATIERSRSTVEQMINLAEPLANVSGKSTPPPHIEQIEHIYQQLWNLLPTDPDDLRLIFHVLIEHGDTYSGATN